MNALVSLETNNLYKLVRMTGCTKMNQGIGVFKIKFS